MNWDTHPKSATSRRRDTTVLRRKVEFLLMTARDEWFKEKAPIA